MPTQEERFEQIDRYLSGDMSGQERNDFEQEIKQNEELAAMVETHRKLAEGLHDEGLRSFTDLVRDIMKNKPDEEEPG